MSNKKFYICITNWQIFDKIVKLGIWGVGEKSANQLYSLNIGDILLIYIKSGKYNNEKIDSSIFGIFQVSSEFWKDENNIFLDEEQSKDEIYPYRIHIEKIIDVKEPKNFRPLINKLSFIKNKERWGPSFMGRAMIQINSSDYKIIKAYLSQSITTLYDPQRDDNQE